MKPVKKTATKKLVNKVEKKLASAKKAVKKETKHVAAKPVSKPKKAAPKKPVKPAKVAKPLKAAKPAKSVKPVKIVKPAKKEKDKKTTKVVSEKKLKETKKIITSKEEAKTTKIAKPAKEEKEKKTTKKAEKEFEPKSSGDFFEVKKKPRRRKKSKKDKKKDDEEEPEILHDDFVEQLISATKKLKAQPKKPRILKTFTNPMASLTVALPDTNKKVAALPKKEPKGKFTLEYLVTTSVGILYEFITSPSGLMEWFADDVSIHDGIFTFVWDGSEQKARLLGFAENEYIKLQWLDKPEGTYFEFRIKNNPGTIDISLLITDFSDEASDLETSKRLWDSQIERLLHVIGSY